ncbi:retrovirus-related pol polyprotein from transposon TNT 1-94 [Tanacetum coccineum]
MGISPSVDRRWLTVDGGIRQWPSLATVIPSNSMLVLVAEFDVGLGSGVDRGYSGDGVGSEDETCVIGTYLEAANDNRGVCFDSTLGAASTFIHACLNGVRSSSEMLVQEAFEIGAPRFEKKESYNLEEAITRRTNTLCLVRHILRSGGKIDIVDSLTVGSSSILEMESEMLKFSIPIFDGKMDFTVWKMTIEDVLVQQGIDEALEEKQPAEMKDDLVCQLANVDDVIKDEEQALLMLSSLPKSYKPFMQTMLTGRTTLTFEDVLKALRDNERMTGNDSSSSSDKVLLADDSGRVRNFQHGSSKGRSKSRMGGDRDMSVVECYYCGDKGYMQVRCPQFREDLKSLRDSKGKKKVDDGEMNVVDNGGDEFLMTETPIDGILREEKPKWVLDNAVSSHICNDRAMFKTLNGKGQFGEIKMGSKQMMKIEGVGSVRFKLHDGSVKTTLNVKYVPGAARNILSLGVLKSRGYRYVGRKDTCKVYKRDQLVIQGQKIPNNLCYFTWKY